MKNNKRRKYRVGNKVFSTLKDLAIAAGISYQAAYKRSKRGWTDEEILYGREKKKQKLVPKQKKQRGVPITIDDVTYKNLRHAFDSLEPSCSYNTVRGRLRYGWSIEEALEVVLKIDGRKKNRRTNMVTVKGVILNVKEASEKFNVPYATMRDRLRRGATPEQALGLKEIANGDLLKQSEVNKGSNKRVLKKYTVDGKIFKSVTDLAHAYDLPVKLVYNRMRDNGWTAKKAVSENICESVTVNGVIYRSTMNAWESTGKTSFTTYQGRKQQGFPIEVCLGLEPMPEQDNYEVEGKYFTTLSDVADAYGLTKSQLTSRLNIMSLKEAVVYKPSNGRYSRATFIKNPKLGNSPGTLYFVKIAFADGVLHKIGITQKGTAQRFSGHDYKVIAEYKGELRLLFEVEQAVIREFSELHYRAEEEFEGRTETFLLMDEEEKQLADFIFEHVDKLTKN